MNVQSSSPAEAPQRGPAVRHDPASGSAALHARPLHDRLIVQRLTEGEQTIGGIIVPESAQEKPQKGRVVAVGNGKVNEEGERIPLDVKAGDLILFGKYTSQEVKLGGDDYLIMREDEVLAVLDESA